MSRGIDTLTELAADTVGVTQHSARSDTITGLAADTVGVTQHSARSDTITGLAADTVGVSDRIEPSRESAPPSLVTDARGCAAAIGMSYDQFRRLCGERAWRRGEIPPPVAVGRGSGTADRFGERRGTRRWRLSTIEAWLDAHEWKPSP